MQPLSVRVNASVPFSLSFFLFFQFILSAAVAASYVPRDYMAIRQPHGRVEVDRFQFLRILNSSSLGRCSNAFLGPSLNDLFLLIKLDKTVSIG